MKKLAITVVVLITLLAIAFAYRWSVMLSVMGFVGPPGLDAAATEPGGRWYDDYFTIFAIDERTFAIGETRYWQKNFSYLLIGDERALLFDAGPGGRDIRRVVEALTDLPYVFTPSHFHYDHVGNAIVFDRVGLIDLPYLRARAPDDRLELTRWEHLGESEGITALPLTVDEWWVPGTRIDLGGREVIIVHTPGHTLNSVSLVDPSAAYAFTGDFFGPGTLLEMVPTGGMGDYVFGVENLLRYVDGTTRLFAAHRDLLAEQAQTGVPETTFSDLNDAHTQLKAIQAGVLEPSGVFPVVYTINERIELWANPPWLQNWDRSSLE